MEATTMFSSTFNLPSWSPNKSAASSPKSRRQRGGGGSSIVMRASSGSGNSESNRDFHQGGGRLVDESMIVLRMRIREIKMMEMKNNTDDMAPGDWMEWEKKYYYGGGYGEDVCGAVGLLQCYLMNVRPSLALGIVAFVGVSLSISCGVTLFHSVLHILNTLFSIS